MEDFTSLDQETKLIELEQKVKDLNIENAKLYDYIFHQLDSLKSISIRVNGVVKCNMCEHYAFEDELIYCFSCYERLCKICACDIGMEVNEHLECTECIYNKNLIQTNKNYM